MKFYQTPSGEIWFLNGGSIVKGETCSRMDFIQEMSSKGLRIPDEIFKTTIPNKVRKNVPVTRPVNPIRKVDAARAISDRKRNLRTTEGTKRKGWTFLSGEWVKDTK